MTVFLPVLSYITHLLETFEFDPSYASAVKNPSANAGDAGSNPGSGRSPGEGNGNPLQSSCLENSMDRRAWWATIYRSQRVGHKSGLVCTLGI